MKAMLLPAGDELPVDGTRDGERVWLWEGKPRQGEPDVVDDIVVVVVVVNFRGEPVG